jgi:hypothetical protein
MIAPGFIGRGQSVLAKRHPAFSFPKSRCPTPRRSAIFTAVWRGRGETRIGFDFIGSFSHKPGASANLLDRLGANAKCKMKKRVRDDMAAP